MDLRADIGVFGGSGFYSFLEKVKEVEIKTPYGSPSDSIALAEYDGKKIAFLRHGRNTSILPHDTLQGKFARYETTGRESNNSAHCCRKPATTYQAWGFCYI